MTGQVPPLANAHDSTRKPKTETWLALIDPVVGARGRVFAVLAHVDLEAPTIAAVLPIGNAVAQAVEERSTPQINVAHQQSAEMTQMADVVGAQPKCSEESKNGHEDDDGAHAHGYGKREKINASVRKENGASDKNSKNGPGSADRGSTGGQGDPVTKGRRRYFDNHVDEPRANAR